ncbi:SMP-30/gluconolactonase/LRE family protein [Sphingomonas daechungensis]
MSVTRRRTLLSAAMLLGAVVASGGSAAIPPLIPEGSEPAVIASGFKWSEGPVWIADGGYLLFSDVPNNRIHRWSGGTEAKIFLEPSGGTATTGFREPGSNGLKPGPAGSIIIADQGNRGVALLDLKTHAKRALAQQYGGKKLNSPNDVAVGPDGAIWFTDPPYGLEGINDSPLKEQPANGVYRIGMDGTVTLIDGELTFPNGLAFSPDGRTLYVSSSDPEKAVIMKYAVGPDGSVSGKTLFADFTSDAKAGKPGLPDGMTVDEHGNLWATAPGGIRILSPDGKAIGRIDHDKPISNAAFGGPDGRTLFMTASDQILALKTNVRGAPARMPVLPSGSNKP